MDEDLIIDDCGACGGSGGGPDPALRCPACSGRGVRARRAVSVVAWRVTGHALVRVVRVLEAVSHAAACAAVRRELEADPMVEEVHLDAEPEP